MPKCCINKKQYKENDIGAWIRGKLFKDDKSISELAQEIDISRQAMFYKLKHNSITYGDLLTIFEFLGSTDEEILDVMRL